MTHVSIQKSSGGSDKVKMYNCKWILVLELKCSWSHTFVSLQVKMLLVLPASMLHCESQLLCFSSSSLQGTWESSRGKSKCLGPWQTGMSSWFLDLTWPNPGHVAFGEWSNGWKILSLFFLCVSPSISFFPCPSLLLSNKLFKIQFMCLVLSLFKPLKSDRSQILNNKLSRSILTWNYEIYISASVNKVLVECSHANSFTYYLGSGTSQKKLTKLWVKNKGRLTNHKETLS